jgi:major membrane immunogen (membrane-anchored lipoprotein)
MKKLLYALLISSALLPACTKKDDPATQPVQTNSQLIQGTWYFTKGEIVTQPASGTPTTTTTTFNRGDYTQVYTATTVQETNRGQSTQGTYSLSGNTITYTNSSGAITTAQIATLTKDNLGLVITMKNTGTNNNATLTSTLTATH